MMKEVHEDTGVHWVYLTAMLEMVHEVRVRLHHAMRTTADTIHDVHIIMLSHLHNTACEFEGESVDDGDCDAYMYHVYFMHKQRFRVGDQCMSKGKSPVNAPPL